MNSRFIIGIDFDGPIANEADYPISKDPVDGAIWGINQLYEDGHYLILTTCRGGNPLTIAKEWLTKHDIRRCFEKVNENAEVAIEAFSDSRKIGVDFNIDDKNIDGLPSWKRIVKIVRKAVKDGKKSAYLKSSS